MREPIWKEQLPLEQQQQLTCLLLLQPGDIISVDGHHLKLKRWSNVDRRKMHAYAFFTEVDLPPKTPKGNKSKARGWDGTKSIGDLLDPKHVLLFIADYDVPEDTCTCLRKSQLLADTRCPEHMEVLSSHEWFRRRMEREQWYSQDCMSRARVSREAAFRLNALLHVSGLPEIQHPLSKAPSVLLAEFLAIVKDMRGIPDLCNGVPWFRVNDTLEGERLRIERCSVCGAFSCVGDDIEHEPLDEGTMPGEWMAGFVEPDAPS